jgi:uncharacterized protein with von Willebrand factor type A (vWA) domain
MSQRRHRDFTTSIAEFTDILRTEHRFGVGQAATRDALRAADVVGVHDPARIRRAFRTVYSATPDEVARFDDAFDAFFFGAQGIAQPNLRSRHTRPGPERSPQDDSNRETPPRDQPRSAPASERDDPSGRAAERRPVRDSPDAATLWQTLRARYSPTAARTPAPAIVTDGLDAMLAHAARLIRTVRIAPSRRRTPHHRGDRIDLRRTLRASVETGGDPIGLRRTARAPRSARFVVLIDGSRSAAEHAGPVLQFAYALVNRTARAQVFTFSTALREITPLLRERDRAGRVLGDLGAAWGGGTRIGDNLLAFVHEHGLRLLSPETLVFIFSDGLDVGAIDRLERALRELRARSAGVVWLNPHAGNAGFTPSARGMRAALPYVASLRAAGSESDFAELARSPLRRPAQLAAE